MKGGCAKQPVAYSKSFPLSGGLHGVNLIAGEGIKLAQSLKKCAGLRAAIRLRTKGKRLIKTMQIFIKGQHPNAGPCLLIMALQTASGSPVTTVSGALGA